MSFEIRLSRFPQGSFRLAHASQKPSFLRGRLDEQIFLMCGTASFYSLVSLERDLRIELRAVDRLCACQRGREVDAPVAQNGVDVGIVLGFNLLLHHGCFCPGEVEQGGDLQSVVRRDVRRRPPSEHPMILIPSKIPITRKPFNYSLLRCPRLVHI
jgi:hypothetical protein